MTVLGDHADELHVVLDHDQRVVLVDLADQLDRCARPPRRSCRPPARRAGSASGSGAITMAISTHWRWPCASWPTMRVGDRARCRSALDHLVDAPCALQPRRDRGGRRARFLAHRQPVEHVRHLGLDADAQAGDRGAGPAMACAAEQDLRRWSAAAARSGILKKVLLPAPFGPIRQRSSPSCRMKSTSSTATHAAEAHGQACASRAAASVMGWTSLAAPAAGAAARAAWRGREPAPAVGHQRGQALGHQQDEDHQQDAQHQVGIDPAEALTWLSCRDSWSGSASGCSRSPARSACRARR